MKKVLLMLILSLFIISGCVSKQSYEQLEIKLDEAILSKDIILQENRQLNNNLKSNIEFMNEYVIGLNNVNYADVLMQLADSNQRAGSYYTQSEQGYEYYSAIEYDQLAKSQLMHSKELLNKARAKFVFIQPLAPNDFYSNEIVNRIKQVDALLMANNQLYLISDYSMKMLYEVNFGSASLADNYFNKLKEQTDNYNKQLEKISDINNNIDLQWQQDWYVMFEG